MTCTDIEKQIDQLLAKYRELRVLEIDNGWNIHGNLYFHKIYEDKEIEDEYEIEIHVLNLYPDLLPRVFETGGKIKRQYHHLHEGDLCLGTPTEIDMKFNEFPSLLGFVDELIVPYLFSHAYFVKNGTMPYGERPHGTEGFLHYYDERFGTSGIITLKMLKILATEKKYGYWPCPCGSGKIIDDCHAVIFDKLRQVHDHKYFLDELVEIVELFPLDELDHIRSFINGKKRKKRK